MHYAKARPNHFTWCPPGEMLLVSRTFEMQGRSAQLGCRSRRARGTPACPAGLRAGLSRPSFSSQLMSMAISMENRRCFSAVARLRVRKGWPARAYLFVRPSRCAVCSATIPCQKRWLTFRSPLIMLFLLLLLLLLLLRAAGSGYISAVIVKR